MYAVIETGGKQYRVELGSEIQVDRLDVQSGDSVTLDRVLLIADGDATAIGRPIVDGATVSAEVLGQGRGGKIVVFKYKPKARMRVKQGFRAELTTLRISDIAFGGKSAAADAKEAESVSAKKAEAAKETERAAAEQAAAEQAAADKELAARMAAADEAAASKKQPARGKKASTGKKTSTTRAKTTKAETAEAAPAKAAAEADAAGDVEAPSQPEPAPETEVEGKADDTKKDE